MPGNPYWTYRITAEIRRIKKNPRYVTQLPQPENAVWSASVGKMIEDSGKLLDPVPVGW
jgi:hypothetical protein